MKAVNAQNQVQAGNLNANGGVLGAAIGIYAKRKELETNYLYRTSLMDYDDKLETRRGLNNTVNKIVYDLTSQATAHGYATAQEAARSKNKISEIESKGGQDRDTEKVRGSQSRRTTKANIKSGFENMLKMSAGLETSAGLPLTGGLSPLVAGPNQQQGQVQAFKATDGTYHPHMGMPAKSEPAKVKPTNFIGASGDSVPDSGKVYPTPDEIPAAAKTGKGKKTKPFADPSVKKNVKPVPDTIATPFGDPNTRSAIFADASSSKTTSNPAAKKA